ncbi:MAG: acyl-ACP thioesterase [Pseudomonadota bacterium]
MPETYRGFVNAWECDENDHVNVQFYSERFEIMARHLYAGIGERWPFSALLTRHIRYHRECRTGDVLRGESTVVGDTEIAHALYHAETGELLATALDGFRSDVAAPRQLSRVALPNEVAPRGLDPTPDLETGSLSSLAAGDYETIYTGVVEPSHLGPEALMADRYFITRVTDGVAHAWATAGITQSFLENRGLGRVAVEMKLTIAQRPPVGTLVKVVAKVLAITPRIITFRLCLGDVEANRIFATTQIAALLMDLKTRKSVPFPDDLRR